MKRIPFLLKAAAAFAALAALGLAAALVALKIYYPEPKLRALAVEQARKHLGREVRLERVSLGPLGLTLDGLEISERPDFKAGTFLRVERFRLRPSWRALLRRQLVVAAVAARGLKVRVVKGADGRFNYETLLSTGAAPSAPAKPAVASGAAPSVDVRRASIADGAVDYVDKTTGQSWSVSGLDLKTADLSLAESFPLAVSARVQGRIGGRPVDAKIQFDGVLDPAREDRKKMGAKVKKLVVEDEGAMLSASGKVENADAPRAVFDATLSAEGRTLLTMGGRVTAGDVVEADVKARTSSLNTAYVARFAPGAGIPALDLPAIEASVAGRFSADRADVRSFRASWGGGRIEGAGSARGLSGSKPVYEGSAKFAADLPEINGSRYPFLRLPPKADVPAGHWEGDLALSGDDLKISRFAAKLPEGTLAVDGSVRGIRSARPVAHVTAVLALDLPGFTAAQLPLSIPGMPPSFRVPAMKLNGTARIDGDDVRLDKFTVRGKDVSVKVDGTVAKALAGKPQTDVSVQAELGLPAFTDRDLPFAGVPPGLRMPPSHWDADASYSPRALRIRALRAKMGRNDLEASGTIADPGGRASFDLLLKCRSFVLDELTQLTPRTREMKLGGSGFFALSVTGRKEKPIFAGKLQFRGIGATVAELPLADFTGTVSFDERRIDVPNLTGKLADGTLKMDLTVKDYSRSPAIQLEASLDRFDLGRYLAAKNKVVAERQAAQAAKPAAPREKPAPISAWGHLTVGTLIHPNATVKDVKVGWDLHGISAELRALSGDASLRVGGGVIHSVGDMATQSKLVKVLIFPLLVVQKIGRIGGIRLFPDFNNIALNQIVGEYGFRDGVMTLRQSEMDSNAARVSAKGTIDLPAEKLDLVVTAQVARIAPIDVAVKGDFDAPKTRVEIGKFLTEPAADLIKGLLHK